MSENRESTETVKTNICKTEDIKPKLITCDKDKVLSDNKGKKVEADTCKKIPPEPCKEGKKDGLLKNSEILAKAKMAKKPGQQMKLQTASILSKAMETISKSSAAKQLIIGSVSGWTTGFLTMKVGKTAAFAVGGGIIIFQIAQHKGLIGMDWDQVKQKFDNTSKKFDVKYGEKKPMWISNVKKFSRSNTCFAAGFVGGFLIGLAS